MKRGNCLHLIKLAVVTLVLIGRAGAEECKPNDSIEACVNRLNDIEVNTAQEESSAIIEERLGRFVTGIGIEDSSARSAVTDFLALFAVAAETGNIGQDNVGLSFALNTPVDLKIGDYKLQATLNDAEIFEPLKQAIPEAGRSDRVDSLEPGLDDFSDVLLSLTWGLNAEVREGFRFGRTFGTQEDHEFGLIYDQLYAEARPSDWNQRRVTAILATQDFLDGLVDSDGQPISYEQGTTLASFKEMLGGDFAELERLVEDQAAALKAAGAELTQLETNSGLERFAELVNNQPQLTLNAGARVRDEIAGPEEYSIKLQLEMPLDTNLNDYLHFKDGCEKGKEYDCWRRFSNESLSGANAAGGGDRLSLSIEYLRIDDYDASIGSGADLVELNLDNSDTLDVVLGYGRFLSVMGTDPGETRFDLSVMYKETFGDDQRQDQFVASASLTRQIAGGAALVFGVNYANKAEFRQESDRDFGANVGLVYRFTQS